MPEGSPAFESILTELSTKLDGTSSLSPVAKFDDSMYHWVPDEPDPIKKYHVTFSDDTTRTDGNKNHEATNQSQEITRGRAQSMGSKKPPRPTLRRSNSHHSPVIQRGKLNKFPLRKNASCSSTPINSPLLQRK